MNATKPKPTFSMARSARLALMMIVALYGSGVTAMVFYNTVGQSF